MARYSLSVGAALLGLVAAQKPGTLPEVHPKLTTYRCTVEGGCEEKTNYIVLDSLAHPVHQVGNDYNCGSWGSGPNATACPTEEACAENCISKLTIVFPYYVRSAVIGVVYGGSILLYSPYLDF
jgi:cellulase